MHCQRKQPDAASWRHKPHGAWGQAWGGRMVLYGLWLSRACGLDSFERLRLKIGLKLTLFITASSGENNEERLPESLVWKEHSFIVE